LLFNTGPDAGLTTLTGDEYWASLGCAVNSVIAPTAAKIAHFGELWFFMFISS